MASQLFHVVREFQVRFLNCCQRSLMLCGKCRNVLEIPALSYCNGRASIQRTDKLFSHRLNNQLLLPRGNSHVSLRTRGWSSHCNRNFHTSSRRNIPPVLWLFLKPIAKFSAALTGRGIRKWFRGLGPEEREKVWASIKRHWYVPAGLGATLVGSATIYYASHIEETPITGRRRFIALTHEQIVKIAETEAEMMIETYKDKLFTEKDLQAKRVLDVAGRLLAANPELRKMQFDRWHIFVINDPLVNACVLPSGHMFVFDGILEIASTQDELAIVLGHEMAHAVLEHGVEELSLGAFVDVVIIFCLAALWCIIPTDGIAIVTHWFYNKVIQLITHMPHSRKLEKEADKVGLMFAAKACYDIRQGSVLWTKMSYNETLSDDATAVFPEWMMTHPESMKRAEHLNFLLPQAESWRDEMQCPRLPKDDPREAMKILSKHIDDQILASKTGQDLRRVQQHPGIVQVKS